MTKYLMVAILSLSLAVQGSASAGKPDYSYPPGVTNPAITQANISTTVCKGGWTKTVRPPAKYTDALNREQFRLSSCLPVAGARHQQVDDRLVAIGEPSRAI